LFLSTEICVDGGVLQSNHIQKKEQKMKKGFIFIIMLVVALAFGYSQTAISGTYRFGVNAYITFTGNAFKGLWNAKTPMSGTYSVSGARLTLTITSGPKARNTWAWTIMDANTLRDQDGDTWKKEGSGGSAQVRTSPPVEWNVNSAATWIEAVNGIKSGGNNKTHIITITGDISIPNSTESTFGSVSGVTITIQGDGMLTPSGKGSLFILGAGLTVVLDGDITLHGRDDNGGNNDGPGSGGSPSGTVTTSTTSEGTVLSGSANLAAKLAWLDRNADSHNTYIVEVNANNNIAPHTFSYSGAINITVILRGVEENRTIRLTTNGTMFTVKNNVTLILDNNITLQGHSQNTGSMVNVDGGILRMNTGAAITGNTGNRGVNVGSGTFEMTGGTISGNGGEGSTSLYGAGVYVGGTFTMSGGTISGNTASQGGGVYVDSYDRFTMSGGTISDNTASRGGGVYVDSYGRFTMSGGTISGNTASQGGGVYSSSDYFTMSGGAISGNTATEYGGGVYGSINKTTGTIIGYNSDSIDGNVVRDSSGVLARRGHAAYWDRSRVRRKETTAGPRDNLSYSGGAWDE